MLLEQIQFSTNAKKKKTIQFFVLDTGPEFVVPIKTGLELRGFWWPYKILWDEQAVSRMSGEW